MPGQVRKPRQHRIKFAASIDDQRYIDLIVERAVTAGYAEGRTPLDVRMDVLATHLNGNPLRLADLLGADDFNFAHDICGIAACLDRETGRLTRIFSPRFSRHDAGLAA